jgi:ferredoxin
MIIIEFNNKTFSVKKNSNLRKVLLEHTQNPYNGFAKVLNCHGMGTCGTCAVKIKGKVSPKTKVEKWRLNFPPHNESDGLRLACQCKVIGDLKVTKLTGFWGEKIVE